jgi:hypothetical protein
MSEISRRPPEVLVFEIDDQSEIRVMPVALPDHALEHKRVREGIPYALISALGVSYALYKAVQRVRRGIVEEEKL